MDLEAMTVDELDAYSVGLKGEIEAIRDRRREAKAVRDGKVMRETLSRKLTKPGKEPVDTSTLTLTQVKDLLGIAAQTPPGEGDVVVTPGAADIDAVFGKPKVEATDEDA